MTYFCTTNDGFSAKIVGFILQMMELYTQTIMDYRRSVGSGAAPARRNGRFCGEIGDEFSIKNDGLCALKMMNCVLNMMNFELKLMNFALKTVKRPGR